MAHGLALVSRISSKNVALPILNNVLLVAEDNQIKLLTTNLELGISVVVRGKIEAPGRYTVQSRLLSDFINFIEHEKITLELTDQGLTVTSGHSHTTIKGLPAEEFPVLPTVLDPIETRVPSGTLQQTLEGAAFAAANDDSRPEISGIYLQINNDQLTVAATDSYRLAERRCQTTQAVSQTKNVILPSRTAQELLRVLGQGSDEVTIHIGDTQARFRFQDVEIVSRLIDGRYPEYQQIIPQSWQTKAIIQREALMANIRAASLFCKPGIHDLTLNVDPVKKLITIQAANTQLGEHEATIQAEIEGQPTTIVFNYRYLLDGLQSLNGEDVSMELIDSQAPGVLRSGPDQKNLYLLMPIRQ